MIRKSVAHTRQNTSVRLATFSGCATTLASISSYSCWARICGWKASRCTWLNTQCCRSFAQRSVCPGVIIRCSNRYAMLAVWICASESLCSEEFFLFLIASHRISLEIDRNFVHIERGWPDFCGSNALERRHPCPVVSQYVQTLFTKMRDRRVFKARFFVF